MSKAIEFLKVRKRRIMMSLFGVIICAISVGVFKLAALGVDPFQSLMSGLDALIPIKFGTLYVIVNVILLLFSLIADRSRIGIATFINLFLLGYITQFTYDFLQKMIPDSHILSEDAAGAAELAKESPAVFLFMSSKDIYGLAELVKKALQ